MLNTDMAPLRELIIILLALYKCYSTVEDCFGPTDDNLITVRMIFTPIWQTTLLERMGAWAWNTTTSNPEFTYTISTPDLPWEYFPEETVYMAMTCGNQYENRGMFQSTIENGTLRQYTRLSYLSICSCPIHVLSSDMLHGLSRLSIFVLTSNSLHTIQQGAFVSLPSLVWLRLVGNNFSSFDVNQFCSTPRIMFVELRDDNLRGIKIENTTSTTTTKGSAYCQPVRLNSLVLAANAQLYLTDGFFLNMNLSGVLNLHRCGISSITASYLGGLENLLDLDLSDNNISSLPDKVFSSLRSLQALRLFDNRLQYLDVDRAFAGLSLQVISLDRNGIINMTGSFSNIGKLREIYLSNNSVSFIPNSLFRELPHLKTLDISNNSISVIEKGTFANCPSLKMLSLGNNEIRTIHDTAILDLVSLEDLNISLNKLQSIEANMCNKVPNIKRLDFHKNRINGTASLRLVACDLEYVDFSFNAITEFNISCSITQCLEPGEKNATLLARNNMIRNIFMNCHAMWTTVNFANNNIANLKDFENFNHTRELILRGNNITQIECGSLDFGRKHLVFIDLGHNRIDRICEGSLDDLYTLTTLYLDGNQLTHLDGFITPPLQNLTLGKNPLHCSCENLKFQQWLKEHNRSLHTDDITCVKTSGERVDLKTEPIVDCSPRDNKYSLATNLSISIATVTVLLCLITLFVYKYRYEIQVIAFYKWNIRINWCFKKKQSERISYKYDAFVCFAEEDLTFVKETLIPTLEPPFRLSIYYRDFPVGEDIADAILAVIEDSAVTIVVLSDNFIKSRWGKFEFRNAHYNAMKNDKQKMLIILKDESVLKMDLDLTLKSILFSKAYLRVDDYLFTEKLLHAMPDSCQNWGIDSNIDERSPLLFENHKNSSYLAETVTTKF